MIGLQMSKEIFYVSVDQDDPSILKGLFLSRGNFTLVGKGTMPKNSYKPSLDL